MVEICTVGGFSEVGKNCIALKYKEDVIVLDLGLHMENYIRYTEDEDIYDYSPKKLTSINAVPDLSLISDWLDKVRAVIITHAHLDHIGAVPFLSNRFNAEIVCTPYSKAVLQAIVKDEKIKLNNDIVAINPNAKYKVTPEIEIEFINVPHSIPQTVMVAVHTPEGTYLYATDFKFDNTPTLGKKPNYERIKQLGQRGIKCIILDSLYSNSPIKMPSEAVAKEMLKDVMLGTTYHGKAVIVTTFASHLARLKSIIEFGKRMNRKIVFLGRSLGKYVYAGQDIGIIDFKSEVDIVRFRDKIGKRLKKIKDRKDKYLIVCTGHQGEAKSVLYRIANDEFDFRLEKGDHVVFSSTVIPTEINQQARKILDEKLIKKGVRIFRDIHVSGHSAREDLRDLLEMVKPENIIPSHCGHDKAMGTVTLAEEMGYKRGKNIHLMDDGKRITF